jgi:tRNA A37 threonylcarbamoyladenosine modification protein TsaB
VSVLPAGRGEVFAQMFCVEDSNVRPLDNAAHITPGELRDKYPPDANMRWAGDAERVFGIPSAGGTTNCLATSVAALGLRVYWEGNLVSAEELRAEYVRASDAEINERWQQQKAKKPV